MNLLMQCGHSANGEGPGHRPCCVSCAVNGNKKGEIPADPQPDLSGREAECEICGERAIVRSSLELAFFHYRPHEKRDEYYCGCWGFE